MKVATVYRTKTEEMLIPMSRVWAMPSPWTFTIRPVRYLLEKYVGNGMGWVDPFAGKNSPAAITNDHNPEMPTKYHMEALAFAHMLKGQFRGVLFDPPYSFRQVSEHYRLLGQKTDRLQTSMHFYSTVKNVLCDKIFRGGVRY